MIKKWIDKRTRNERITTEVVEKTVVKLKPQEIEIQNIDHLGIVAGIIDSIGIVEIINELIETKKEAINPIEKEVLKDNGELW